MKIKTFEQLVGKKSTTREIEVKTFQIPKVKPRNSGRVYNCTDHPLWRRTLWQLLLDNELIATKLTRKELQAKVIHTHKSNRLLARKFRNYDYTIGMYRKMYNIGNLYASQPPVHFLSFEYDSHGYVVVGGRFPLTYMYFEDCYQRCLNYRVADPRFVPHDYIVEIRNQQIQDNQTFLDWVVPNEIEIRELKTLLKVKELYNSVKFRAGFTREETPHNWTPLKEDQVLDLGNETNTED